MPLLHQATSEDCSQEGSWFFLSYSFMLIGIVMPLMLCFRREYISKHHFLQAHQGLQMTSPVHPSFQIMSAWACCVAAWWLVRLWLAFLPHLTPSVPSSLLADV